jgi:dolichol-phosphate mannosyltransferase
VPAYNCEAQIVRVLEKLKNHQDFFSKIVVIENCSADSTFEAAKSKASEFQRPVEVLRNSKNIGLGGSLKRGFEVAIKEKFDDVIVIHGDDQAQFEDMRKALSNGRSAPIVIGARFHPDSKLIGYSQVRRFGNITLNTITGLMFGQRIFDMIAGLNYFHTDLLLHVPFTQFENDLTFDSNILFWCLRNRISIQFAPITWRDEDQISNARVLAQTKKILLNLVKSRFQRHP